jgi:hypothetical protein
MRSLFSTACAAVLLGLSALTAAPAVAAPPAAEQRQTIVCLGEGSTLICMTLQDFLGLLNQPNGTSGPACGQDGQRRCTSQELW